MRLPSGLWTSFAFFLLAVGAASPSIADLSNYCGGLVQVESISGAGKRYALPRGAKVTLREEGKTEINDAIFLGRTIRLDESTYQYAFYEPSSRTIRLFPSEKIRVKKLETDQIASEVEIAPVPHSRNQQGGTCAAYTLYNCFRQLKAIGRKGNKEFARSLVDEGNRQDFLATIIDQLYVASSNGKELDGVIRNNAKRLGFEVFETKGANLPANIQSDLEKGWPVVIRFDCGSAMCEMPYKLFDHLDNQALSNRLWQPNTGGTSAGGHAILITGLFEWNNERYLVVTDPNYQAPRIWPVSNLNRWSSANLRAWTIWEKIAP